jgi:hypothetical protein
MYRIHTRFLPEPASLLVLTLALVMVRRRDAAPWVERLAGDVPRICPHCALLIGLHLYRVGRAAV